MGRHDDTLDESHGLFQAPDDGAQRAVPGLCILWSLEEPHRVGEVALLPSDGAPFTLGRAERDNDTGRAVRFRQPRLEGSAAAGVIGRRISRRQLELSVGSDGGFEVKNIGRCTLSVNGAPVETARLRIGDVLHLDRQLVLRFVERPSSLDPGLLELQRSVPFGGCDTGGLVGETPVIWELRRQLVFAAARSLHVLLLGPTGSGKELAARCIHAWSERSGLPLVARNAATLPEGILDAELFGNVRDYPNPGMVEREGLIGAADGSTLFLDEIGELPEGLQAHLLRVLDADGEYQRLGEARVRRADFRLLAATNRAPQVLKEDVAARFALHVTMPALDQHADDIPLIARHLLLQAARGDSAIAEQFVANWDGTTGVPRIDPTLVEALCRHSYRQHARELNKILWRSMTTSRGNFLAMTPEVTDMFTPPRNPAREPAELTPAEIQDALDRNDGNQKRTYKELGLSSRDALYRLIKKHKLIVRRK